MGRVFPYFKLRIKEDENAFLYESKVLKETEKALSKMYFYLFLYPFIEIRKFKTYNDLSILKFDVWEESSLRESKIRHLPFLIKKIFNPKEIYFVDIDKELVKMARKNMKIFGFRKAIVVNGDIRNLPFSDEKFDIVIDFSTTDHLTFKDLKKTIKEVYRVLKEDGIYLMYHLNSDYFNIKRWNYRYKSVKIANLTLPSFPRIRESIENVLSENGFLIHKKGYTFPFYFDKGLSIYWTLLLNNFFSLPPFFLHSFFNFPTLNLFFYIVAIKRYSLIV
jgi:SAM-dependent methyltransferase